MLGLRLSMTGAPSEDELGQPLYLEGVHSRLPLGQRIVVGQRAKGQVGELLHPAHRLLVRAVRERLADDLRPWDGKTPSAPVR
jgi:hypothetical protein